MRSSTGKLHKVLGVKNFQQKKTSSPEEDAKIQVYFYPKAITHVALVDGDKLMSYSRGKGSVGGYITTLDEDLNADIEKYGEPIIIDLTIKADDRRDKALQDFLEKPHDKWQVFSNNCAHAVSSYLITSSLYDETKRELLDKRSKAMDDSNEAEYLKYHRKIYSLEKSKRKILRHNWDAELKKKDGQNPGKILLMPREVAKFANKISLIQEEIKRAKLNEHPQEYRKQILALLTNDLETMEKRKIKAEIKNQTKKINHYEKEINFLNEFKKFIETSNNDNIVTQKITDELLPRYIGMGSYGGSGLNDYLNAMPQEKRDVLLQNEKAFLKNIFQDLSENKKDLKTRYGFTPSGIKHLLKLEKDNKNIDNLSPEKTHVLFHEVMHTLDKRKNKVSSTRRKKVDDWYHKWSENSRKYLKSDFDINRKSTKPIIANDKTFLMGRKSV